MAPHRSTRRLSLDMTERSSAMGTRISDISIFRYMDLGFPTSSSASNNVRKVVCECCGLSEDCTDAYVQRTKARLFGKWFCGLCSEAVNEESYKMQRIRDILSEEALHAHMEICRRYNKTIRPNPAKSLARAMSQIVRSSSKKNM